MELDEAESLRGSKPWVAALQGACLSTAQEQDHLHDSHISLSQVPDFYNM
jgi:hypothetical protein